jgi:hypothetical protein
MMLTTLATAVTPILGEYLYVGGGLLGTVLVVLLIVFLIRRA